MANLLAPIENTPYVGGAGNSFITVNATGLQVTLTGIDGELLTWSAAGVPETVAAGTSGQILTSNGAGSAPTFQAGGGGGINNVVEDTSPQYGGVMDTNSFALDESEGTPVANAASMDIWAVDGNTLHITGSTGPTTSLGTAPRVGAIRRCIFDSTPTWNDGANLILPGSANFTFAADDIAYVYAETTTQFRVIIFKGDGTAVVGGGGAQTPWTSDIDQNGFSITDGGGLEILSFVETASAVNEITVTNAATGNGPSLSVTGGDTDSDLNIDANGAGDIVLQNTSTGNIGLNDPNPVAFFTIQQRAGTNNDGILLDDGFAECRIYVQGGNGAVFESLTGGFRFLQLLKALGGLEVIGLDVTGSLINTGANNAGRVGINDAMSVVGSLGMGALVTPEHATTAGTNVLSISDGTAPVGTLTNGASFYSASGEMNVIDSGGVVTLLSPHDEETGEWIFRSKNTVTGRTIKFRMEELMKRLAKLVGPELFQETFEDV